MAKKHESTKPNNKPTENISVNKKYDEKGNLVQYDSVYTYSYSSNSFDTAELNLIMVKFPAFFNQNLDNFTPHNFLKDDTLFLLSSLWMIFFEKGFFNHDEDLLQLMQKMVSLKQKRVRS